MLWNDTQIVLLLNFWNSFLKFHGTFCCNWRTSAACFMCVCGIFQWALHFYTIKPKTDVTMWNDIRKHKSEVLLGKKCKSLPWLIIFCFLEASPFFICIMCFDLMSFPNFFLNLDDLWTKITAGSFFWLYRNKTNTNLEPKIAPKTLQYL